MALIIVAFLNLTILLIIHSVHEFVHSILWICVLMLFLFVEKKPPHSFLRTHPSYLPEGCQEG